MNDTSVRNFGYQGRTINLFLFFLKRNLKVMPPDSINFRTLLNITSKNNKILIEFKRKIHYMWYVKLEHKFLQLQSNILTSTYTFNERDWTV